MRAPQSVLPKALRRTGKRRLSWQSLEGRRPKRTPPPGMSQSALAELLALARRQQR